MKKIFSVLIILLSTFTVSSQTIFGKWENRNEDTDEVDSVIEIYKKDGKAYARISEILDEKGKNSICDKCTDHRKNQPILCMDILSGLIKDGDEWSGGEILDPKKGKIYGCYIKLKNLNKLKVKGHLKGVSFLGRTVYWYRKK